ncbi:MAG TPA: citrate synthase [Bacteroidetes bacterium]|nr:citrate synthase [Bacteroidota bacterium]
MPKICKVTDKLGRTFEYNEGLEGVIATSSEICFIDGEKGKLLYRGIPIEQLAEHSTFEETSFFLLYGHLPSRDELEAYESRLKSYRPITGEILEFARKLGSLAKPMHLLRTIVSAAGVFDPDADNNSIERNAARAEELIALFPTIVAALQRLQQGKEPIAPNPDLGHAANFLYMLNGEQPNDYAARVFDICLILHAEHGFNASTFTARAVISTLTDMYSAVTAAIGSLKGPLHGGANEGVMHLLNEIGEIERTEEVVLEKLRTKTKIMGFGHRVYKALDPRAKILMQFSEKLAQLTGNEKYYNISKKVEEIMAREVGAKGIYPNVDFFSASVYHYLGIDTSLFTPIFAVSRVSGWTAHVLEQLHNNRLLRPRAVYLGEFDRSYIPMSER